MREDEKLTDYAISEDEKYMRRCIQLAQNGVNGAAPNPMVGAVVAHRGRIIGEGYHIRCGGPHAEVNAIRSVKDESLLSESTIYVSLEPCSHYGKTPPCADLIISKHIPRVVVGCIDPFAKVQGRGIQKLRDAGIEVKVGVLEQECLQLNRKFMTFNRLHRPFVTLKWAESADGFIDLKRTEMQVSLQPSEGKGAIGTAEACQPKELSALPNERVLEGKNLVSENTAFPVNSDGKSSMGTAAVCQSLASSPKPQERNLTEESKANGPVVFSTPLTQMAVHRQRAEHKAILVGRRTALLDNPSLTVRHWIGASPLRLVIDKELTLPRSLRLFDASAPTWVFTARDVTSTEAARYVQLDFSRDILPQIMASLYEAQIQSLLVEGGRQLLQSFIDDGLWDEIHIERSPLRLGSGIPSPDYSPIGHTPEVEQRFGRTFFVYRRE